MPQQQMSALQIAQQNAQARAALLATAPRFVKNLGVQTSGTALTTRQKLFNVGVLTKLLMYVQLGITIGTATAVPSGKAPWNVITRARVTDYDNTDRVNLSGFQLFILNCVRWRTYYSFNNEAATAVFTNPNVPTTVGSYTIGTNALSFFIEIPIAFDIDNPVVQAQDLRGAIMCQTAVGEMYLTVDWTSSLYTNNDVESVYAGAATTTVVGNPAASTCIQVQTWQEFLMPQAIGGAGEIPLPPVDLQTVYELQGNIRSSDQIAANSEKLLSYPNVRSVIGGYWNYITGGALSTATQTSGLRLIVNGNAIVEDDTALSHLFRQRRWLNADIVPGVYWKNHKVKPVETWLLGNVQLGFTPITVSGGNQYIEVGYESFYTKGAALPGVPQAG